MEIRELRVGNWIDVKMLNGSRNITRTQFHFDLERYCHLLIPIPLTPEILEKAGFEEVMAWTYSKDTVGNNKLVYYLGERGVSIGYKEYSDIKCQYLHQLQNLYFALTGEELNIKL